MRSRRPEERRFPSLETLRRRITLRRLLEALSRELLVFYPIFRMIRKLIPFCEGLMED